jgi:hypothetical protein
MNEIITVSTLYIGSLFLRRRFGKIGNGRILEPA